MMQVSNTEENTDLTNIMMQRFQDLTIASETMEDEDDSLSLSYSQVLIVDECHSYDLLIFTWPS